MSDDRPVPVERRRPQFGELATPEEQRAAIAVPLDPSSPEPVPVEPGRTPVESPRPVAREDRAARSATTARPVTTGRQPVDRFVSWGLLGVGLFNILTTAPALFDLPAAIEQFFSADDLGAYGPVAIARVLGIGAFVVSVALWTLTFVLVQRRVAAGRTSWWIPVVAGVVANIVFLVCVGSAMTIDPAVFEHIQRMSGGGA